MLRLFLLLEELASRTSESSERRPWPSERGRGPRGNHHASRQLGRAHAVTRVTRVDSTPAMRCVARSPSNSRHRPERGLGQCRRHRPTWSSSSGNITSRAQASTVSPSVTGASKRQLAHDEVTTQPPRADPDRPIPYRKRERPAQEDRCAVAATWRMSGGSTALIPGPGRECNRYREPSALAIRRGAVEEPAHSWLLLDAARAAWRRAL